MISANAAVEKYGKVAESIDTKQLNQTVERLSEDMLIKTGKCP
jgi:hypothetical protein